MFAREPFSGPAEARVDLVEDEQRIMFVAKPPEQRKEFRRWNVDPATDLDGFDQDRADVLAAEQAADLGFGFRQPNPSRAGSCPVRAAWPVSPPRRGQGWVRPSVPVTLG